MKLLSVTVPCYNSENYMRHCIDSLLIGGEDVEILIVDDGSTKDATAAIADEYEKKYPSIIRAIHQENKGHGGAVNTGIANATGMYFKVVDSDDWLDARAYGKVLEKLREFAVAPETPDLIINNYVYDKEGAKRKKVMRYPGIFPTDKIFGWDEVGHLKQTRYVLMHSMITRTQLLRDVGLTLPEHTFYVDNIFAFVPFSKIQKMYYMDVNLYRYYIGRSDQSVNESVMIGRIDQQERVNYLMIDYMKEFTEAGVKGNQRKFLLHSLSIIMTVTSAMLIRSKKPDAAAEQKKLWRTLKEKDSRTYRQIRWQLLGFLVNLPGKPGKEIFTGLYKITQKIFGFN